MSCVCVHPLLMVFAAEPTLCLWPCRANLVQYLKGTLPNPMATCAGPASISSISNCSHAALCALADVHADAPGRGPPQQPPAWLSRQPVCVAALSVWLPCLQYLENMRGPQARAAVERVEREIAASQAAVVEAAQVRRHAPFHVTACCNWVAVQP